MIVSFRHLNRVSGVVKVSELDTKLLDPLERRRLEQLLKRSGFANAHKPSRKNEQWFEVIMESKSGTAAFSCDANGTPSQTRSLIQFLRRRSREITLLLPQWLIFICLTLD